jgi:hypothetical protein
VLPVVGLLLAGALGADPLFVLLHTPLGLVCLGTGIGLDALGVLWTNRLVRRAAGDVALLSGLLAGSVLLLLCTGRAGSGCATSPDAFPAGTSSRRAPAGADPAARSSRSRGS